MNDAGKSWEKIWREARRELRRATTVEDTHAAQVKLEWAEKQLGPRKVEKLRAE